MANDQSPSLTDPYEQVGSAIGALVRAVERLPRTQHAMPALHNPAIEEPFASFVRAMANELRANAHKGDRTGWLTMTAREAVSEVLYHAAKLAYAAHHHDDAKVLEFAADVANCALMVADVCGTLPKDEVHG